MSQASLDLEAPEKKQILSFLQEKKIDATAIDSEHIDSLLIFLGTEGEDDQHREVIQSNRAELLSALQGSLKDKFSLQEFNTKLEEEISKRKPSEKEKDDEKEENKESKEEQQPTSLRASMASSYKTQSKEVQPKEKKEEESPAKVDQIPPKVEVLEEKIESAMKNEEFDSNEYKKMRDRSFEILKAKFSDNTAAICDVVIKATSRARKDQQDARFYSFLVKRILRICELEVQSWQQYDLGHSLTKREEEKNLEHIGLFLAKQPMNLTLSHATLLSDLTDYLEKEIDRIVIRSVKSRVSSFSVPMPSRSPAIKHQRQTESTKTKILNSIKEYSQMLLEEKDPNIRDELFKTLEILNKQLNVELKNETQEKIRQRSISRTSAYSTETPSESTSGIYRRTDFLSGNSSQISTPSKSYDSTKSRLAFNQKKHYPQSVIFSKKLKSLRKSYGSWNQMNIASPRGTDGALEEIFIFYSYKTMGTRPGGMTSQTEWIISMVDLQRLVSDFNIPLSKTKVQEIYKRISNKGNGFFTYGLNFQKFKDLFLVELGRQLMTHRIENLAISKRVKSNRLKKLQRRLEEKDYRLQDDDIKEVSPVEFETEIELLKEEIAEADSKLLKMEQKPDQDLKDMVLDLLKVKGDPRKYRMLLPGYARSDGRLGKSERLTNVLKMKKHYDELCSKPREEVKDFLKNLNMKRIEVKVSKDVEREVKYQKSRQAINFIHQKLIHQKNIEIAEEMKKVSHHNAQREEKKKATSNNLNEVEVINPVAGSYKNIAAPSKRSESGIGRQTPLQGEDRKQGAGKSVQFDEINAAQNELETAAIESIAPGIMGNPNKAKFINGANKREMLERAQELEQTQKLSNLKSYEDAMKRQENVVNKGLRAVGR